MKYIAKSLRPYVKESKMACNPRLFKGLAKVTTRGLCNPKSHGEYSQSDKAVIVNIDRCHDDSYELFYRKNGEYKQFLYNMFVILHELRHFQQDMNGKLNLWLYSCDPLYKHEIECDANQWAIARLYWYCKRYNIAKSLIIEVHQYLCKTGRLNEDNKRHRMTWVMA